MGMAKNLGKEKIIIDKDQLLLVYFELDELYIENKKKNYWEVCDKLDNAVKRLEKVTGFEYHRTLKKVDNNHDIQR